MQASSSGDGTVRVWHVNDQAVAKTWPNVINPSNSFHSAETVCHISWESTTGRLLAIPTGTEIKVYQRSTWNLMMTLSDKDNNDVSLSKKIIDKISKNLLFLTTQFVEIWFNRMVELW